ncbi:transmembrane protein 140 isoform X2 [Meleagris gallopavo]|uniref:transmembrane protein 140 isoform X2 n=1 Tax=Meleagris gallopavo TaxID=9103 RepID=UPI00093ED3B5|nr:transmembrane protein 140 isoform X2 [Meleagris gallopavo]
MQLGLGYPLVMSQLPTCVGIAPQATRAEVHHSCLPVGTPSRASGPTAGFTMVSREHLGHGTALLCWRYMGHLLCALTILEIVGTLGLMIYALLVEAGNLVNLPNKRIGFYNFCLWNETAEKLQCLEVSHLQAMGISWLGIALARSELGEEACQRGCGIRRQTVLPTLCKSRQVALLQEAYVTVIRDSAATTSN